jgi:hypothetical protein
MEAVESGPVRQCPPGLIYLETVMSRSLRLCSQFRQEFVDLTTRKSGLIADTSKGHHHCPRAQRHIQVVSKYALLDATFQHCHQVGVPSVIKLSK